MTDRPFSLCVYCGSRDGADPAYRDAATELGRSIAARGWRLVYGAGDVGLMGAVADAATTAGAPTLGVIPTHLLSTEAPRRAFGDRVITETMHERKKVMFMNADAVAVLPGGAGSLDEFFEVLTWAQLGLHAKPIVLLDVNGYWQPLVALVEHVIHEGFAAETLRGLFTVAATVDDLVAVLEKGTPA
ncbi:TIGR00730 family Rossman fold protein [Alphaproteobacteria bacterium GH1-50]|uniref:Cytokinin riboside 5'-monophosphate phosphoribohydrolase n=1 Tax=Kangsaoukella pontilimi TaxID=2691042 RepID=A0A7C9MIK6_9RHOB|nr:TIGR00730 family Rossman fold protein [Kangsaoukella pontilimi]MXQ06995.1 TIGR00730 family Rossman fold protein [Kangsaoukella pontilimi]